VPAAFFALNARRRWIRAEIAQFDIDLTREFLELEKKFAILKDVSFLRAMIMAT